MSDDLVSPEDINAFRQDAARFRFLAQLKPEWTITHKAAPEEQYIMTMAWQGHYNYASLAEFVDTAMSGQLSTE